MKYGTVRYREVLQPVSGKALPLVAGETLHISLIEGPQCVDFNCFNLHDYKEHMSVGHMRMKGFRAHAGHIIWSRPPRYNPMMLLVEVPESCVTDLLGARCHAVPFEKAMHYPGVHTNCQDIQAECIGEYGLTPDDVHDSLNFWMNSGWDEQGRYFPNYERSTARKGDCVVLLATMDVLAVPNICGGGDFSSTSNYWFNPVEVAVCEATDETRCRVEEIRTQHTGYRTQRGPADFRVREIKADRALHKVPGYEPQFSHHPIGVRSLTLTLKGGDLANLDVLLAKGLGSDREDALRYGVMSTFDVTAAASQFDETQSAK